MTSVTPTKCVKMFRTILAAAVLLTTASAALAQTALADGQVTKIDKAAGKISIRHGPLKRFGMDEGMTMVYRVADPALLEGIKISDKIKFSADRTNGQFTVTKIEKAR
jgi:Cu(I)/Ag(I) efflux system periplasmic protein CusF